MSFVSAAPQMSAAATELSSVGSSVGAAHAAGLTAPMAGITGMGADEVPPGPGGAGGAGGTDGAVGTGGLGDSGVIQAAGNAVSGKPGHRRQGHALAARRPRGWPTYLRLLDSERLEN
jgi:hypothetical protein